MSEIFDRGESGYVFLDKDAVLTPPQVERFLKDLHNEVGLAQLALRRARTEELRAYEAYVKARKPHELDPDCPEVGSGAGKVTAKAEEMWFERRIPEPFWRWKEAVLARQNATSYVYQIKKQTEIMQSINANCRTYYSSFGGAR